MRFDTILIWLISGGDQSAYVREVARLVSWRSSNNLELNAEETVKMIVDFRKVSTHRYPQTWEDPPSPSWTCSVSWEPPSLWIWCGDHHQVPHQKEPAADVLPVATEENQGGYQDVGADLHGHHWENPTLSGGGDGCRLKSLQDLYTSRRRAAQIKVDPSHLGHKPFVPLPSGRK